LREAGSTAEGAVAAESDLDLRMSGR
jgi:hypothetical protein